jgi:hypothetical protein
VQHYPLIDWVDAKCRTWGFERRKLRRARAPHSPRLDEPIGHGIAPEPTEGLTGDALLVAVAIRRALEHHSLTLRQHAALYLHYDDRFRRIPARCKYADLSLRSRQGYYYLLSRAHKAIDSHWPTDIQYRQDMALDR